MISTASSPCWPGAEIHRRGEHVEGDLGLGGPLVGLDQRHQLIEREPEIGLVRLPDGQQRRVFEQLAEPVPDPGGDEIAPGGRAAAPRGR